MTGTEYQIEALRTRVNERTFKDYMIEGTMGLCGEAGETTDLVKKHIFQGHKLDSEHIAKELGDIMWYISLTAYSIGYDLDTIMQINLDKLKNRYPEGFDSERSRKREKNDI